MANATIDLTDADNNDFPPINGTFDGIVFDVAQVESQSGNDGLKVIFKIQGGEHDGRKVNEWYWMTKAAAFRFKGFLEAVRPEEDWNKEVPYDDPEFQQNLCGLECKIEVVQGEDDKYPEVDEVYESSGDVDAEAPF